LKDEIVEVVEVKNEVFEEGEEERKIMMNERVNTKTTKQSPSKPSLTLKI